jgi:hypothetical protein
LGEQCENLFPIAEYIKSLSVNRITFIQKHHLKDSDKISENFRDLIDNHAKKYKMEISKYEKLHQLSSNGIKIDRYKIEIFSWHDCYVFEMIKKISELSPGFINFKNINISRISKINLKSPSIKAVLSCDLYYRN